jgi:hypothetical protein
MIPLAFLLHILLTHPSVPEPTRAVQLPPPADCREWHECRELALAAAARREFETFHDLAWRAIQTGPKNDPALMYMLARAQSLSGRPHDALVMLERLAEMGVATDAATNDDFRRVRLLPDWPELNALIERVHDARATPAPDAAPTSTSRRTPPSVHSGSSDRRRERRAAVAAPGSHDSAAMPPAGAVAFEPEPVELAVRILMPPFSTGGLAYDAVSGRFVVGDAFGRKLIIVEKGADHAVDLVRADSAGFHVIRALEIDRRDGDLWVATATPDDREWTIHRLQLVSGRPLKAVPLAESLEPMKLVDLAISPAGAVLALDAVGNRLLELPPGRAGKLRVLPLGVQEPTSVAATDDRGVAYVAHAGGVARVDLTASKSAPLDIAAGLELGRIERIRWYRNALLAVQSDASGARQLVRFDLNASGRAVTAATVIDRTIPAADAPMFATVSGDELFYVAPATNISEHAQGSSVSPDFEFTIRRVRLR